MAFYDDHPHPGDHESAAADLAVAAEDWRTGATARAALADLAADYAAGIPDWYRDVPELHAAADRLAAAARGDDGYELAERVGELLDLETRWHEDYSADQWSAMHGRDPWPVAR